MAINNDTGDVAETPDAPEYYEGLSYDAAAGLLWGAHGADLFHADPETGEGEFVGELGAEVTGRSYYLDEGILYAVDEDAVLYEVNTEAASLTRPLALLALLWRVNSLVAD
ncbi:MAG: hypothetical protein ACJAYU_005161 [Bradymonadia bacterium]|jgi:hypothetical protein